MKIKSAHETAGLGKHHRYLGHFARPKFINQGHNDLPMSDREKKAKVYSDTEPKYDANYGLPKAQHNMDEKMISVYPAGTKDSNSFNPTSAAEIKLTRPKVKM